MRSSCRSLMSPGSGRSIGLLMLAAASCVLPDYAPTDRPCPCIAGYRCEAATQTCVPEGGGGASSASAGSTVAASTTDATANTATTDTTTNSAASSASSGLGALLFEDDFDATNDAWSDVGNGMWAVLGGERWQQDADADYSFTYVTSLGAATDYEVVSRLRMIGGANGGAMEIVFRTDPSANGNQYFCNWEPTSETIPPNTRISGQMLIMAANQMISTEVLVEKNVDFTDDAAYDPKASLTMHVRVVGNTFHCWIEEIAEADITATDDRFTAGAVGFKTYEMSTAYDYIRVYAVP